MSLSPPPFPDRVREVLAEAKQARRDPYGVRLKWRFVYGSQARGEARPSSDDDLMIVLGDDVEPDEEARRTSRLMVRIAGKYGVALSPLHLSEDNFQSDRPLPLATRREGIVL